MPTPPPTPCHLTGTGCHAGEGSYAWLFPQLLVLPPSQLSELTLASGIFYFCSQMLSGSNWKKSKTARRLGRCCDLLPLTPPTSNGGAGGPG